MSEKVTFDKLLTNINSIVVNIKINDIEVKVKQYLPVNEKLLLISRVMQNAISGNEYSFVNPVQLDVYTTVEILKAYTDIEFPEDMEISDLYDKLEIESISNKIIGAIPATEYAFVQEGVEKSVNAYYNYRNSALGIMEAITQDYSNLNLEASEIQQKIADPNNLALLKNVVTKLG